MDFNKRADRYKNRPKSKPGFGRIYIANIPWSATRTDIINLVKSYTNVYSAYIPFDKKGRRMGFAFLSVDNAASTIRKLNGVCFGDRWLYANSATVNKTYIKNVRKAGRGKEQQA